mmetsp:Transcript_23576/g.38027  ORF Transcript_23576/g.38027 Transcript_23576/m.38027 type:complete len:296 (-) Transcript_23576:50-937(-)
MDLSISEKRSRNMLESPLAKRLSALHLRNIEENQMSIERSQASMKCKRSNNMRRSPSMNPILSQDLAKISWNIENPPINSPQKNSVSVPLLQLPDSSPRSNRQTFQPKASSHDSIPTQRYEFKSPKSPSALSPFLSPPHAPRSKRQGEQIGTSEQLRSLRVSIPRPFKIYDDSFQVRRRRPVKHPLSPMAFTPVRCSRSRGMSRNRSRPLHLWKTRHVARWAQRIAPESVTMVLEKKLDGEGLLRVETEKDLLGLGWSEESKLSILLRDIQNLQTDDILWHINNLKHDSKLINQR